MSESKTRDYGEAGRYLCFSSGQEKFAIPLLEVKEVLGKVKLTSIPQSPVYFKGVINLRGQIVSIIDLRQKLKSLAKSTENLDATTIILDFGTLVLGIAVDTVDCVREYKKEQLSAPPDRERAEKSEFILSIAREEENLVLILDLKALLNTDDYKVLKDQSQKRAS